MKSSPSFEQKSLLIITYSSYRLQFFKLSAESTVGRNSLEIHPQEKVCWITSFPISQLNKAIKGIFIHADHSDQVYN